MAKNTKLKTILVKKETSYAGSVTPTGSANAVEVVSLDVTPIVSDEVSRNLIRPYFGNQEVLLANKRVELTIGIELSGSGTAGTLVKWSPLLEACGLDVTTVSSTSNTFTPLSGSFASATIWYYTDGIKHEIKGCRGTFSISCEVGQIPVITFAMTGLFVAPTDTAIPSTTFSNQAKPVIFKAGNTTAFQFFGYAASLMSWSFDLNNNIVFRELVGGTTEVLITDRNPSGSLTIEAPTLAQHNYFADATGTSTGTNTWQHSGGAGNIVTMSVPQSDISAPAYSEADGIVMLDIPFMATPSAANNEFSLAFT